jgi:hypothetical protein
MAKSRGQDFEDEIRASIPDGVFVKKLHTPAPPPSQVDLIVAHLRRTQAPEWMAGVVGRSTHTPRQGYDMLVAPGVRGMVFGAELRDIHGAPMFLEPKPVLLFCLELKSTKGKSFTFSALKPHQEEALRKEALAGRIAGIVVEFSEMMAPIHASEPPAQESPIGDVLFIPILSYLAYKSAADRASLPYAMAERIGLRIEIDTGRGRTRRYYKMAEFLRAFGADIPETSC